MKKRVSSFILINIFLISFLSKASDNITLNFSGNIRVSTCNISNGSNINVDLKNIPAAKFEKANTSSEWNNFYINFTNCSTAINQIHLTFSGVADTADANSLYKNQGSAKNIAVQLENGTGTVKLGNKQSLVLTLNGKTDVNLWLRTRAFSPLGKGMPGTISAKVTANIVYL
ncbi:fimbrial subunit [Proteus vulgaris]|uniref:fimbrial protein n=1 Tax=Proteus vulgaris TaxID=585 RepID=UPI000DFA2A0A|nr:fimbrial protein [Proteus vulgaris]SUC20023.1 fimbrial subunit [Proteus vulgaris]